MEKSSTIAFIGGGNMAQILIQRLVATGMLANHIWVSDRNQSKLDLISNRFNVQVNPSNIHVIKQADIIVLAVKPQDMRKAVEEIKDTLNIHKRLIITIAAGITTALLEKWIGSPQSIVRAMPNTPALLGASATGLYANTRVDDLQRNLAESLLRAVGITVWLNHEKDLDTVTALSGSGPAYFFLMMESLQMGAEALGLNSKIAKILTLQTALGAAKMALESDVELQELRKRVASPGGTTEYALNTLENGGLRKLLKEALGSAKARSIEIGHIFDEEQE